MTSSGKSQLAGVLKKHEQDILADWIQSQLSANTLRSDLMTEAELREQSRQLLNALQRGAQDGQLSDANGTQWQETRDMLTQISRSRAHQGYTPTETATFVFSLKQPVFARLRKELGSDSAALTDELWQTTMLLDKLALLTTERYQQSRDELIARQQRELLELSTPVVQLWHGVLALPLIGTLDSERTQVVMESLLQKIVETSAPLAIIDITGVPTVDTLVAQHLLKTVAAARLMGADCIISGIRPQIAQTIVHLGVDLADVVTKATLADAFAIALKRMGLAVARASA
jgi:rsbT co-antagonist protein RsbR